MISETLSAMRTIPSLANICIVALIGGILTQVITNAATLTILAPIVFDLFPVWYPAHPRGPSAQAGRGLGYTLFSNYNQFGLRWGLQIQQGLRHAHYKQFDALEAGAACLKERSSTTEGSPSQEVSKAKKCQSIGVHPFLLSIPLTIATSLAFMLPASTPPNAIIFSKGRVPLLEMVSVLSSWFILIVEYTQTK
ncbi:unnamed protein product [Dibothriocephalus latus]|uniref:Citrate transporter-like domain-containing protein n=1 Tax=Dibothriocephalus latus TaxID=60516 RepID=A0A3P6QMK3_DIBLA|nr:unnamed protein product [Dibothriocephalus latus]